MSVFAVGFTRRAIGAALTLARPTFAAAGNELVAARALRQAFIAECSVWLSALGRAASALAHILSFRACVTQPPSAPRYSPAPQTGSAFSHSVAVSEGNDQEQSPSTMISHWRSGD